MLWEVVPQPNGAWEEGVEVGVDRGLGDPELKVAVSSSSAEGMRSSRGTLEYHRHDYRISYKNPMHPSYLIQTLFFF